jgi:hypothetical protein
MTWKLVALRREPVLSVSLEVPDLGPEAACRYEAELTDFPALREAGRTPWEAINRLLASHRGLLERRWST